MSQEKQWPGEKEITTSRTQIVPIDQFVYFELIKLQTILSEIAYLGQDVWHKVSFAKAFCDTTGILKVSEH